jgi:tetratricopeptide (TPR) repeat protein
VNRLAGLGLVSANGDVQNGEVPGHVMMELVVPPLDVTVSDSLQILALIGVLVALTATVIGVLTIARSTWRVTFGPGTLVLPFGDSEVGPAISEILAEQLDEVERDWQRLSLDVKKEEGLVRSQDTLVDLGPRARALSDRSLDTHENQFLSDQPLAGQAMAPITFAGISVSPDTVFSVFYRLRTTVARRTISGSLHEFGATTRLSALFVYREPPEWGSGRRRRRPRRRGASRSKRIILVRDVKDGGVLELIDDLAFLITKARLEFTSEADRWSAYRAFLTGYADHLRFLRTGKVAHRDLAIGLYQAAIEAQPAYLLALYNLGTLLYNRYTEDDNARAIEHFRAATEASDERLRALALSGLTLAYAQNVSRFGLGSDPWVALAEDASREAVQIAPDLEEAGFARAFAYQIARDNDAALEEYARTVDLPGNAPIERQIKSFAQNNRAYLLLTVKGDLEAAEQLFRNALDRFQNKMAHANLGEIHKRRKEFDLALAEYQKARELDADYVAAINETGMVYLAMARDSRDQGRDDVAELIAAGERWHQRALAVVPTTATHQREMVSKAFEDSRSQYGL